MASQYGKNPLSNYLCTTECLKRDRIHMRSRYVMWWDITNKIGTSFRNVPNMKMVHTRFESQIGIRYRYHFIESIWILNSKTLLYRKMHTSPLPYLTKDWAYLQCSMAMVVSSAQNFVKDSLQINWESKQSINLARTSEEHWKTLSLDWIKCCWLQKEWKWWLQFRKNTRARRHQSREPCDSMQTVSWHYRRILLIIQYLNFLESAVA